MTYDEVFDMHCSCGVTSPILVAQVALIRKAPTFERKAARMAALLRSAQFIGRYTSDLAGREARQLELTTHWYGLLGSYLAYARVVRPMQCVHFGQVYHASFAVCHSQKTVRRCQLSRC